MTLKTTFLGLTALFLSLSHVSQADEFSQGSIGFDIQDEIDDNSIGILGFKNPFFFHTAFDFVGASEITKDPFDGDKLHYSNIFADLDSFVYYDECHSEGVTVGINYAYIHLGWHQNPAFSERNFNLGGINAAVFTGRFEDWVYKAFVLAQIDLDHLDFNHYLMWDIGGYGSYHACDNVWLNFGFFAQLGMKADRVWPVLGFIWDYSDCIRIDAVFPVDLNIYYKINKCWSAGIGAQFLRTRDRVGHNENVSQAIWVYENAGLDVRVNYQRNELTYATFHVGYMVGGKLKIADKHYDERHHYDFDGAPYAGGEIGIKF